MNTHTYTPAFGPKRAYEVQILPDEYPPNPREEWDNLGIIAAWHRRYDFNESDRAGVSGGIAMWYDNGEEGAADPYFQIWTDRNRVIYLPVYLFDHSGLRVYTRRRTFNEIGYYTMDQGHLGYIYATPAAAQEWFGWESDRITENRRQRILNQLQAEVNTWDDYLSGNVWGYNIPEIDDSCWGFYGDPDESGLIESIQNAIDCFHHKEYIEQGYTPPLPFPA